MRAELKRSGRREAHAESARRGLVGGPQGGPAPPVAPAAVAAAPVAAVGAADGAAHVWVLAEMVLGHKIGEQVSLNPGTGGLWMSAMQRARLSRA